MSDKEKIETIKEIASQVGGYVCDDYSGRSMYGQTCYGIVCDSADSCIEEAASRGIRGERQDNMGKQYIVYWPSIKGMLSDNLNFERVGGCRNAGDTKTPTPSALTNLAIGGHPETRLTGNGTLPENGIKTCGQAAVPHQSPENLRHCHDETTTGSLESCRAQYASGGTVDSVLRNLRSSRQEVTGTNPSGVGTQPSAGIASGPLAELSPNESKREESHENRSGKPGLIIGEEETNSPDGINAFPMTPQPARQSERRTTSPEQAPVVGRVPRQLLEDAA